uniref:RNA-directed DNA polymerase, eukaryota, reverse transcriptase zinc-binding domain protein n=1 Tax=Tanacetum cinerariifolium TaxID=118510 RepID=A0A6L2LDJ5_TANCI|nr:RNA-directed DNA polymerase, eukaryota, reverse transcriptase zinc-binding domain protein [Tanacetum cinerariifolium]
MPPISSLDTGGPSSQQHTHQPMSLISLFSTIEELADEHEICDEYLTDGYLTEQQEHQLRLDEETLRETLKEATKAEKELALSDGVTLPANGTSYNFGFPELTDIALGPPNKFTQVPCMISDTRVSSYPSSTYGHVVDSFIPNKRSKTGKRFGFVRVINVFNEDRLVNNLCTVWIGRDIIHANLARFKRPHVSGVKTLTKNEGSKSGSSIHSKKQEVADKGFNVPNSSNNSFAQAVKRDKLYGGVETESDHAVVLDDECLADKDLSKSLLGREMIKLFSDNLSVGSWFSCIKQATLEFITKGRIAWVEIEGIPFKLWSNNTFKRIANRWGVLLEIDDQEETCYHSKRLCVHMKSGRSILENFKIIHRGKDGGFNDHVPGNDEVESDMEEVPKTLFEKEKMVKNEEMEGVSNEKVDRSEDPFLIYPILEKKNHLNPTDNNSVGSIKYPPGFTPLVRFDVDSKHDADVNVDNGEEVKVFSVGKDNDRSEGCVLMNFLSLNIQGLAQKAKKDWVKELCSKHKVNFLALQETKMEFMNLLCVKMCWGNLAFEYAKSDSVGNSRGIICVWDPNSFSKHNASVSDYFVMVRGVWRSSGQLVLLITVYALQEVSEKQMLWDFVKWEISKWNGDVVIMGDFNEVRYMSNRFRSTFNAHGASLFNSFISSSGLMEVNLGGSAYTWCYKSASKMTLFISDLKDVDSRIDNGHATEEDAKSRVDLISKICDIDKLKSIEMQSVMECDVTNVEIKNAVWDCGTDKAPGPDGFLFGFYRRFWYLIEKDVCDAVKYFFTHVDAGLFHGLQLGGSANLSHMFYADNAVFVGQWSEGNINSLVHALECFNLVSGLKINMRKSKIMGVHVNSDKVNMAAKQLGCLVLKALFIYLRSTVGETMSKANAWCDVVDRVRNRLSKWKMKTLSIESRLTLLKSVLGSMPIFHMSMFKVPTVVLNSLEKLRSQFFNGYDSSCRKAFWVKWKLVMASKGRGGLGVSSLYALNRGLLFKWLWRFYSQDSSLWTRVIKAIHGVDGKADVIKKAGNTSCWLNIIHEVRVLKNTGIDLKKYMHIKLGNGANTAFWKDNWSKKGKLKTIFPRLYALESNKLITVGTKLGDSNVTDSFRRTPRGGVEQQQLDEMVTLINSISLAHMANRMCWDLESLGEFSIASVWKMIDDTWLPRHRCKALITWNDWLKNPNLISL